MSRIVLALYLTSIALLPWTWFPPFPWLHEHAQWSDAVFAAAAAAWLIERWQLGDWPRLRPAHAALALYLLFASLSLLIATPNPRAGAPKLLGVAELCTLAFITSEIASRPGLSRSLARVVALTSLFTLAAALAGLFLFYAGVGSPLIGIYGELEPSPWYARVQACTYNPNLLASFCIFAAAITARREGELSPWLRRITLAALWITVLLTFSRGILAFALSAAIRSADTPRRRALATVFGTACAVLILSLTFWRPLLNPARPFDTRFERAPSNRYQAMVSSLAAVVAHPVLGTGLDTHPAVYQGGTIDAHCTPLNIAATLGLPVLVTFTALFVILWRKRRLPVDLALWGGLAGLAVDALAQDIEDFRHLWVMIGLAGMNAAEPATQSSTGRLESSVLAD